LPGCKPEKKEKEEKRKKESKQMSADFLPEKNLTLLTGATGALGQELLFQWLDLRPNDEHLLVLARGGKSQREGNAEKRIHDLLRRHYKGANLGDALNRITVLDGDVTLPLLGLNPPLFAEVAGRINKIIHCAAAVRFDQPLDQSRLINLEGTRNTLELALTARRSGREVKFDTVSTAYIAGKRSGTATEIELEHKKGFHNTYEQSKYEAELLVRRHMDELPITIYRPSIIIGNSQTGETGNFKAFYWPIRIYAQGQVKAIPADPRCRVDLVPVDYVARSILYLSGLKETTGQTYHLTAGRSNLVTVREVADASINFFKVKPPFLFHPRYMALLNGKIGRKMLGERTYKTLQLGQPYYPYLGLRLEFDNSVTAELLSRGGIIAPPVKDFFDRLFRYCHETDWGRRAPSPKPVPVEPITLEAEETTFNLQERPSLA
jgi:thioester reductase-like protein